MSDTAYFQQTQFISNSNLKELGKLMYGGFQIANMQAAFDFGSLLDAHLTEKSQVKKFEALVDEDAKKKALLMKQAGEADPTLKLYIDKCKTQHEIYRNSFTFTYNGWTLTLPVRIKLDFYKKNVVAGDLKSTASATLEDFVEAIEFFDYDQQAALYMDVCKVDKFMFIGISKKADKKGIHNVFKFAVQRGDKMYKSGLKKYSHLAYYYKILIHDLNFNL